MRVASAAYPLDPLRSWEEYEAKLSAWVADAEADLLVFPEYGAMELAYIAGPEVAGDLALSRAAVAERLPEVDALHQRLARAHGCHILAASAPVHQGGWVNRARLFAPNGSVGVQDKQIMTHYERAVWGMEPGGPLSVIDTALGKLGILICYDCEFPLLARALVEAGAELLLVPSCTDTGHGFHRVEVGARARALENQCVTVVSATVGSAAWCPAVDENVGQGAVFGPPDLGFPEDGVLARGPRDTLGWVRADVDLSAIARVRSEGHVRNHAHWPEQMGRLEATQISLRD
ncbi:MAG: carbon-nitrogen hydrolase family protein [Pseudomonadota bacterium]